MKKHFSRFLLIALLLGLVVTVQPLHTPAVAQEGDFQLTILHNNDGESQLMHAGSDLEQFGGVARFATLVNQLQTEATAEENQGVVLLSSGDNFLAGPEFNVSREKGVPFYDSTAVRLIGYDAMAIGNHEFDFGPEVLAQFIQGVEGAFPFVSANLNLSGEPALQALVDEGTIRKSTIIDEAGQQIGVVGATYPDLAQISSPRNVTVNPDVAGTIQAEIDAMQAEGVNKIIVISHLQSVDDDMALAAELSGVDVMIAGGGDELLANAEDLLVPGDEEIYGSYPLTATGADGAEIPVVTTPGDYKYVGRLVVTFDAEGNVTSVGDNSGLVRVAGGENPDAVLPDETVQAEIVDPVEIATEALANNVIATSEVALEGRRDPGVRTLETNEGNLMADALLWQAREVAADFNVPTPNVALQNGGGIRNNTLIPAGDITELTTFDIAPFSNFVTVVQDVPAEQFKRIIENAVSEVEEAGGRFAQIAGFTMAYDPTGIPQELADDGSVVTEGTRVQSITLEDGTAIVEDGAVVEGAPALHVATIDFLARGGDQYPFADATFTPVGVSYQKALYDYIAQTLEGTITAEQYPEGGEGRITTTEAAMAEGEMSEETPAEEPAAQTEGEGDMAADEATEEPAAQTDGDMAESMAGCRDYTVQANDWLSTIAEKELGDVLAYQQIFEATNAAAAAGGNYATLSSPGAIEVGQLLCIPTDTAAGETTTSEAPAEDATTEDAPAEDAATEDAPAEDAATEDAPAEDAATEDAPAEDAATEDAPAEDAATEDAPAEDAATEDAPAEGEATEDAPAEGEANALAPASGQARVYFQNLFSQEYNVDLGDGSGLQQIPPGVDDYSRYLEVAPDMYNPGLSIAGGNAINIEVDMPADTSWLIVVLEDGRVGAVQIYPES